MPRSCSRRSMYAQMDQNSSNNTVNHISDEMNVQSYVFRMLDVEPGLADIIKALKVYSRQELQSIKESVTHEEDYEAMQSCLKVATPIIQLWH
ncbi:hypothetical protein Tco_0026287 [Tanacetum coccineum]